MTLTITFLIVAVGIAHGTWHESLPETSRVDFGHSPLHIISGGWQRIATSLFLTGDPWHLKAAIVMTLLCVGWLEIQRGWFFTTVVFVGSHTLTTILEGVILTQATAWMNDRATTWLMNSHEVGPSAGYYGCLGACLFLLRASFRGWAIFGVTAWLAFRLLSISFFSLVATDLRSDLAHLLALPIGMSIAKLLEPIAMDGQNGPL